METSNNEEEWSTEHSIVQCISLVPEVGQNV